MILRRVIEHVKAQNWFAVAIDFVIVVAGVFVGIQVSNWNAARQANADEAALFVRLVEEFESIEPLLARSVADMRATTASTGAVIEALRQDRPPADEAAFRRQLAQSNWVRPVPGLAATYMELVSTGGLSGIEDNELRAALTRYGDAHAQSERMFPEAFDNILDPHSDYYKAVDWNVDPAAWNGRDAIVGYDWAALRPSRAEMQAWISYQVDLSRLAERELNEIRLILTILRDDRT